MFGLDNFGNTPLLEAIKNGHDHVASLLVKAGGVLTIDDAGDFICKIVARKDVDLLKRLLAYGINPNVRNYDHRTPLHIAASEGSYSVARLLLESRASVLCRDRWGNTPLSEARLVGDRNLIKLFEDGRNSQSSELVDCSQIPGTPLQKRKCTIFLYHPLDRKDDWRKPGIVLWVPQTLEELIMEAKSKLNISSECCLLAENGGRITDPDMVRDDQNLFLVRDEEQRG